MEFSLDAKPIPVVVVLPLPRAPHSILINEGQDILQIRTMMQVIKLGYAICVVARQRMRRNVVDLLVSTQTTRPSLRTPIILGCTHVSSPNFEYDLTGSSPGPSASARSRIVAGNKPAMSTPRSGSFDHLREDDTM